MTDEKMSDVKKSDRPFFGSRIVPIPEPDSEDKPYPRRVRSTPKTTSNS